MILHMQTAGYVLAGGSSRRMGRDKALLPVGGRTLLQTVASQVNEAVGSTTIVGSPEKYKGLGFPVIPDLRPNCGPLAGIEAALSDSQSEWTLIAACDMPGIDSSFLRGLVSHARPGFGAIIPVTPDERLHPLCAVYHATTLDAISGSLDDGIFKVLDALQSVAVLTVAVDSVQNANTPAEWADLAGRIL